MASSAKKPCIKMSPMEKDVFSRFAKETTNIEALKNTLTSLTDRSTAVASVTIKHCNATYKHGRSFSKADVDAETNINDLFPFASVFRHGINLLETYLNNPGSVPCDDDMALILSKLLMYLLNKEEQNSVMTVLEASTINGCDMAIRFAEHFFIRLCSSDVYTLDSHYSDSDFKTCNCGCKTGVGQRYGDTSIGDPRIWHGCLDIILRNIFTLPVTGYDGRVEEIEAEDSLDSYRVCENMDGKLEVKINDDIEDHYITSQLLAQTIVFSFAQKKRHPDSSNFLIPTIGINRNSIIFYFYEPENDILLKSQAFQICLYDEVSELTILAAWFVVNYKYLCSGLTADILKRARKSNFHNLAQSKLQVYQKEVQVGGVSTQKASVVHFLPHCLPNKTFWSEKETSEESKDSRSSKKSEQNNAMTSR